MHNYIANATWQIQSDKSYGSGFSFIKEDIVVTNHHVIEPSQLNPLIPIFGYTEDRLKVELELVDFSPKEKNDWAILRIKGKLPENRIVLAPESAPKYDRGQRIIFSGFPHGISHLLTNEAHISGKIDNEKFYINGMINGGNSGGPIINADTGKVIGIITQRRFLGFELQKTLNEIKRLQNYCEQLKKGSGGVNIMGIDFVGFAGLISSSLDVVSKVVVVNANSGIGIGFSIENVASKIKAIL